MLKIHFKIDDFRKCQKTVKVVKIRNLGFFAETTLLQYR